jgi:NADPH:quinone reductase-like Zn-dependent oxidoreductase
MLQTLPKTLRAVAIDRFGGPETMKIQEVPMPEVGPDDVLINVQSAGIGVWDPFEREGGFAELFGTKPNFPYVLGSEGAGIVVDVGERVEQFTPGDHVYAVALANPKGGFYAEYAAVMDDAVSHIPGSLTIEQAGVLPVDAITALRGLDDTLHLVPGQSILIFGASGGIGHLAVQFAKRMGARVLAVASGQDGVEFVQHLGANAVLDGHKDDVVAAARKFAPGGLDAALITAGGEVAERALSAMRDGGRVAYPSGVEPEPQARSGVIVTRYDGIADRQAIEKINRLIGSRSFEVHVARTFLLDQVVDAHRALDSHFLGKLALRPSD